MIAAPVAFRQAAMIALAWSNRFCTIRMRAIVEVDLRCQVRAEFLRCLEFGLRLVEAARGLQEDSPVRMVGGRTRIACDDPVVAADRPGNFAIAHGDAGQESQDEQVVWIERDRTVQSPVGGFAIADVPVILAKPRISDGEIRIERDRLACRFTLFRKRFLADSCLRRRRAGSRRPTAKPRPLRTPGRSRVPSGST